MVDLFTISISGLAIDALNPWIDKAVSENGLNAKLLKKEKDRLKEIYMPLPDRK